MLRLLSIVSLILMLVLFPPAALAVISNNAVPGQATYPIKRGLENLIYGVASLNPTTKAWFAKARSDRRFQEITVLISQGKKAGDTLNELVEQTQIAATQINKISDPIEKEKLKKQLTDSIAKYDQGLAQISQAEQTTPSPQATIIPRSTAAPQESPTPAPSAMSPTPTPTSTPTPSPNPEDKDDIKKIRDDLDKIKKRLEKENNGIGTSKQEETKEKEEQEKKVEKEKQKQEKQEVKKDK